MPALSLRALRVPTGPVARLGRVAMIVVVIGMAAALLLRAFDHVDWRATFRAVFRMGPLAPLVLLPWLAGVSLDAAGMHRLLVAMERPVRFAALLAIRVATEALHLTAPAGFLVADSMTASLLATRAGVPVTEGAVLAVARKWLVTRAHAAYIVVGAASGASLLTVVSLRYLGGGWLAWAIGATALAPLSLSFGLGLGFRRQKALVRIQSLAAKLPWRALRERAAQWREGASAGDKTLARIGAARDATWSAAGLFFGCWLFEAVDTALILRLLGVSLDFGFAMGAEVAISMLRSVGNVLPAGLGVQDAGYATLLPAMGVAPDAAAAFVLVKRGKELAWIGIGFVVLGALRNTHAGARRLGFVSGGIESVAHAAHAADEGGSVPELLA
jgi:hypothetical protein